MFHAQILSIARENAIIYQESVNVSLKWKYNSCGAVDQIQLSM